MLSVVPNIVSLDNGRECSGCSTIKPFSEFYKRKENIDGKYRCKSCEKSANKIRRAEFRKKNPELFKKKEKEYRADFFSKHPNYTKEMYYRYREKNLLRSKEYSNNNPIAKRCRDFRYKYGLTFKQVEEMISSQNHLCANRACGKEINMHGPRGGRACVDHNHQTGKVRELLCISCNTALGLIEQKNKMIGLTEYLQKHDDKGNSK